MQNIIHAVDLGAGYCEWIAAEARKHPRRKYAAVENDEFHLVTVLDKRTVEGLPNLALAGADAFKAIEKIRRSGAVVREVHLRAPDALRNKLAKVLSSVKPLLHPKGKVVLTTDFTMDSWEKRQVAKLGYSCKFVGQLKKKCTRFEKELGKKAKILHYVFKPAYRVK